MRLASVNIGEARAFKAKAGQSGIVKLPSEDPVRVTRNGLLGDTICDTENHGGVDQAVYVYGAPDYAWWSETLGKELRPGTFGENLTVTDIDTASLQIGDRLHVGSVLLEVTAPRIPCVTLAARMEDPAFAKRFRQAERPGVYCRVLQEGHVQVGDEVTLRPYEGETVGALELFQDFFKLHRDEATLRRHLTAPIAVRDRVTKEAELQKLLQAHE